MTFNVNNWFHTPGGSPLYEVSTKEELLSLPVVRKWEHEHENGHWEIEVSESIVEDDVYEISLMWVSDDLRDWLVVLECDNANPKEAETAKTWLPIWESENMKR